MEIGTGWRRHDGVVSEMGHGTFGCRRGEATSGQLVSTAIARTGVSDDEPHDTPLRARGERRHRDSRAVR